MASFKPCVWVHIVPTSGQTVNVPIADGGTTVNLCLDHTSLILALTIVLPITGVQDGQIVKIASKSAITGVTVNAETGGLVQGLLTSLLGSGNGIYQFEKSTNQWYKFST